MVFVPFYAALKKSGAVTHRGDTETSGNPFGTNCPILITTMLCHVCLLSSGFSRKHSIKSGVRLRIFEILDFFKTNPIYVN